VASKIAIKVSAEIPGQPALLRVGIDAKQSAAGNGRRSYSGEGIAISTGDGNEEAQESLK
jgi:hypothetical protein